MSYIEFKRGEKHAGKDADISDTPDAFSDCGYLLEEDDLVIDIDETGKDIIKQMISWFDIKTQIVWTDRGAHLYFKLPSGLKRVKNGNCALGFKVEMKTKWNTPNGITIKRNGVMREIENEGMRQELPLIFSLRKNFDNLLGLSNGDGRNDKMFRHKMQLANCEGWNKILNFINTFVFAEPLPDKEFEVLTRPQNINSQEMNENYIAELIVNMYKCKIYLKEVWFKDGDDYKTDEDELKRLIFQQCSDKKSTFVEEVLRQIYLSAENIKDEQVFHIKLQNGIIKNGKFYKRIDDSFTPYSIDIEYHEDAPSVDIVDEYIKNLTGEDEAYKQLLMEVLAYPLVLDPAMISSIGKFFFFRGDGRNGKGTLLQIIRSIYGPKNCTSMSLTQLTDHAYSSTLIGKLANLGDDIEPKPIDDKQMKMLKNLTTADVISTRRMYQNSINMRSVAKLFFTTNTELKTYEKGYAYQRRVMWLPMFTKVEKPDGHFVAKITTPEALEYWIRLIVEAYVRLYNNGKFTESDVVKKFNADYHKNNNEMALFIESFSNEELDYLSIPELRDKYRDWCGEQNAKFNATAFSNTLSELRRGEVKGVTKDGKTVRRVVFRKQKDSK